MKPSIPKGTRDFSPTQVAQRNYIFSTIKSSFENLFSENNLPEAFQYLIRSDKVILSPHVAGWTVESNQKLAQTIVDKVKAKFY